MNPTPKRAGVGRIPPEILSEIFLHCLPVDSASQNTQQVLSSVCRLWHTLALATPALWASLDIACGVDVLRPPLPVIRTHLRRSQTHPLSFILRTADPEYLLADRPSIHIRLDWITQETLDLITEGDAPLLQSIRCDPCGLRGLPIPLRMLDRCPRLESFQWGPRRSFGSPLLLPLSDTKLTSLSLEMISAQECIALLRLSPRLSSARFHVFNFPGPSATPHLTHPTLHTLTVVGVHFTTLPALLDLNLTTGHGSLSAQ
ncbi:hypothetical protein BD779DRAFT_1682560 [Infundibulicybe gibba]|nr:hypothetical protein BD779DRAFT_1682560 [Infundibulicybe gibba]